ETIMRMHIHQDSDYWFDYETDQGQIWGASQYLPNNCMVGHINKMDDYSFRSVMASSLCLGWIADAPDFDLERAKKLVNRYREVRHLVIGAWYPLLLDHRDLTSWSASQYHRPDLNEGMILVFRREESPIKTIQAQLHGLDANATYELTSDNTAEKTRAKGSELMKGFEITLPERHMSDLIQYCRAK
ncbi:MAG: hypothetical protein HYX78_13670, partial [Armatimonadetes bacterium]|nr:hypothetical protein [Armatimonadota bacterium]